MIERFPSSNALLRAAAEQFIQLADDAISKRGRFVVALSGGTTPHTMYEQLASADLSARVNWSRVFVFWGDERCVPPGDQESNFRLAYQVLLLHVPIPRENFFRIHGELPPEQAAQEYEERLRNFFNLTNGEFPRFDLILLGLGRDGHTASLFPNTPVLHETRRKVVAHFVETLGKWRITFTLPVINAAANVTFLVSGAEKAEILTRTLDGTCPPENCPARLVQPVAGTLNWMVDDQAAVLLEKR